MTNHKQLKAPASSSSGSSSPSSDPSKAATAATAAAAIQTEPAARPRSKHSRTISNVSSSSKRRSPRSNPSEYLSDRATAQLIRRVLCPQQVNDRNRTALAPVDELLPPLTSRNDVDIQLYAIIAIILRDFVQTWYNKITPDETFVAEIVQIIAHCSRTLEQRLRKVDMESLLLDELPDLLDKHVEAYRASRKRIVRPPIEVDPREIYHSLCPLPYLSPIPKLEKPGTIAEQADNETAYRQLLVQGVLAVLLPTEDLENECLTSLVGQIFSEIIIGGVVAKKISEPWMIWTGLTTLADVVRRGKANTSGSRSTVNSAAGRGPKGFSIQGLFWSIVHYLFVSTAILRVLVSTLANCRTLPSRGQTTPASKDDLIRHNDELQAANTSPPYSVELPEEVTKTPIMAFGIWSTISKLLEMDRRMPWLCGSLSMAQWLAIAGPGRVAGYDGVIDR
ncbi:PXA domain protein 1 [Cytospora mali]|uniref:PXA domain protein 1 n=1 Tax=Cytospora mali TaxID=578113 RepID=A0A194VM75_CYTMA|nr:PXA domain protein 1 [Valsa mali]